MEFEKCYKLCLDIDKIDLNIVFNKLTSIGDVILFENTLYIWLSEDNTKKSLMAKLKKLQIFECYCQLVKYENVQEMKNFLSLWFIDHQRIEEQKEIEKQQKDKLKEMLSNIEKAKQLLQERVQQSTQQAVKTVEEKNTKA